VSGSTVVAAFVTVGVEAVPFDAGVGDGSWPQPVNDSVARRTRNSLGIFIFVNRYVRAHRLDANLSNYPSTHNPEGLQEKFTLTGKRFRGASIFKFNGGINMK
jgi:hypothetical protein